MKSAKKLRDMVRGGPPKGLEESFFGCILTGGLNNSAEFVGALGFDTKRAISGSRSGGCAGRRRGDIAGGQNVL